MNTLFLFVRKSNLRQKRTRLNEHQSRSNNDKLGRFSHRKLFMLLEILNKIVRHLRKRNIINKEFSLSNQFKKKVQRTFENLRFDSIRAFFHLAIIAFSP